MDFIKDLILTPWSATVILGILSVILGKGFLRYKKAMKEIFDIAIKHRQITDPKSPGGITKTRQEKDEFVKEIIEAIQAVGVLFKK